MSKAFFRITPALLSCCTVLSLATSVGAVEPACDLECIKGFSCQIQAGGACPEIANGSCDPTPYPACIALECSTDADCADHMKCYDDDDSDGHDEPPQCVPQSFLDCSSDADCGAGFNCLPFQPCLDPAVPDCVPSEELACFITEMRPCQAHSDCLPGWTCENNPLNAFTSNGVENRCLIRDPALICMPPHSNIFGINAVGFIDFHTGVEGTSTSVPESECPEPTHEYVPYGRAPILQGPPEQADSEPAPATTGDDGPATSGVASTSPTTSESATATMASASGNSGCSIAIPAAPRANHRTKTFGFASVLGLLGLIAARRSRTARRG